MANDKLAELFKTQISLTEWFNDIKHKNTELIRQEDSVKINRIEVLNKVIGLPYGVPTKFKASQLNDKDKDFNEFLNEHKEESCALRLSPIEPNLPKLRMRGKSVGDAYEWFKLQDIEPEKYKAEFMPHTDDSSWSTIFVVNTHGIFGEIIYGSHSQLTQGFHDNEQPTTFTYDFSDWKLLPQNDQALKYLKNLIEYLKVDSVNKQKDLSVQLGSTFSNNFLNGYFETVDSSLGTWFLDYSPVLGEMFKDLNVSLDDKSATPNTVVQGRTASPGKVKGIVKIVADNKPEDMYNKTMVLVCKMTSPDFLPAMQKVAAVVTDEGGILSHAAIVTRELKLPCIVGTGNATKVLKDGQHVEVNADKGIVSLIGE